MIEVLSKPADQLGLDDTKALITSEVPEGAQIEFKESLPTKRQTPGCHLRGMSYRQSLRGPFTAAISSRPTWT